MVVVGYRLYSFMVGEFYFKVSTTKVAHQIFFIMESTFKFHENGIRISQRSPTTIFLIRKCVFTLMKWFLVWSWWAKSKWYLSIKNTTVWAIHIYVTLRSISIHSMAFRAIYYQIRARSCFWVKKESKRQNKKVVLNIRNYHSSQYISISGMSFEAHVDFPYYVLC